MHWLRRECIWNSNTKHSRRLARSERMNWQLMKRRWQQTIVRRSASNVNKINGNDVDHRRNTDVPSDSPTAEILKQISFPRSMNQSFQIIIIVRIFSVINIFYRSGVGVRRMWFRFRCPGNICSQRISAFLHPRSSAATLPFLSICALVPSRRQFRPQWNEYACKFEWHCDFDIADGTEMYRIHGPATRLNKLRSRDFNRCTRHQAFAQPTTIEIFVQILQF